LETDSQELDNLAKTPEGQVMASELELRLEKAMSQANVALRKESTRRVN
jgi:hypothetical protein